MANKEIDKSFFRNMKGEIIINDNKIFIKTEFGHKILVKPELKAIRIDTVTEYDEPFKKTGAIEWNATLNYKEIDSSQVKLSKEEIREIIKDRDVIPPTLDYDYFHIGFVFPPKGTDDPNKFRWWLSYFKGGDNVYNMFADELDIEITLTTDSWQDKIIDGFYHGRFKVLKSDIKEIKEIEPMKLKIYGKEEKSTFMKSGCLLTKIDTIKIFYDIKYDYWHVIEQDHKKNVIKDEHVKNLAIKQMPMKGTADRSFQKPRVSFEIPYHNIKKMEKIGDLMLIE